MTFRACKLTAMRLSLLCLSMFWGAQEATAEASKKPHIVVIWGD